MRALGPVARSQRTDFRASRVKAARGEPNAASVMLPEVPRIANGSDFSEIAISSAASQGLALGAAGDDREREADRMASRVPGGPVPAPRGGSGEPSGLPVPAVVQEALRDGPRPLDAATRAVLEPRFGHDLSRVRVHAGDLAARSASAVGAEAYTVGQHVVFGAGHYNPQTPAGRRLLAHEVAHTLQPDAAAIVRRQPAATAREQAAWKYFYVTIPADVSTTQQFLRFAEVQIFGRVINLAWDLSGAPAIASPSRHVGEQVTFRIPETTLAGYPQRPVLPATAAAQATATAPKADGAGAKAVNAEADRRFYQATGITPGTRITPGEAGRAAIWNSLRRQVLTERATLGQLPDAVRDMLGPASFTPEHYQILVQLGSTLSQLTDEELKGFFQATPDAPALTPGDYAQLLAVARRLAALPPEARKDYLSRVSAATGSLSELAAALDRYARFREARQAQATAHEAASRPLLASDDAYSAYHEYLAARRDLARIVGHGELAEDLRSYRSGKLAEAQARLLAVLRRQNFGSIEAFEAAIESYRLAFRTQAVNLALDALDRYEHMLFTERAKLAAGGAGGIARGIAASGAAGHFAEARRQGRAALMLSLGASEYDTTSAEQAWESRTAAAAARQQGEAAVRQGAGNDPLVNARGTDLEKLAGLDEAGTKAYLTRLIGEREQEIAAARHDFAADPDRVFSHPDLVTAAESALGIDAGTIYGRIINDYIADESSRHLFSRLALAALAIAVVILVPGGGWLAAAALVTQAGVSTYQVYEAYQEYQENKRDWDLGFLADEPSLLWVGVAIAGAALDIGPAASAVIRASAPALRALRASLLEFSVAGGELEALLDQIKAARGLDPRIQQALIREATTMAARALGREATTAAAQARQAWRGAFAAAGRLNTFTGTLDPAVVRDIGRALYASVKRGVTSVVRLSAEARFLEVTSELARMTGAERAALETAFDEVKQLVAAGQARGMDEEALLGFIDRWAAGRGKPGLSAKLAEDMKAWRPPTPEQRRALSALKQQKETVAGLYEERAESLAELLELRAKGQRTRLTSEEIARSAELEKRLKELDPSALPRREGEVRYGKGEIHEEEYNLSQREKEAARAKLTPYDRLRVVSPSDQARDQVLKGVRVDQVGRLRTLPTELSVDHIVSVREITEMDGFSDLFWKDQKAIVDMRENLIAMDRAANSSKSDWTWRTWPQAPQFYDLEVIKRMADREVMARDLIKREIEKRLAAMPAGARP
jgi:Domain of unknown function (DUF4157)